jgi:cob(I)alamin adenosyltransferase
MKDKKVMAFNKGYVQVYTGDGKGKTTAATGLIVRALSRGLRVCLIRFLKGDSGGGECALLKKNFKDITVIGTGSGEIIKGEPSLKDKSEAERGISEAKKAVDSLEYDIVILDEINVAISLKLIELDEALGIIREKPESVELVLTGRGAAKEIIDAADLVTKMKQIKHYYDKGVNARIGIEE